MADEAHLLIDSSVLLEFLLNQERADEVALCSDSVQLNTGAVTLPVILKECAISYPPELLPYVRSELVFYGEMKQIPLRLSEGEWNEVLIARLVAYTG